MYFFFSKILYFVFVDTQSSSFELYNDQLLDDDERFYSLPGSLQKNFNLYLNDSCQNLYASSNAPTPLTKHRNLKNIKSTSPLKSTISKSNLPPYPNPNHSKPIPLLASVLSKRQALSDTNSPTLFRTEYTIQPSAIITNRITFTKHNQKK
jgi:hypothetical protein